MRNEDGKIVGASKIARDITEQRRSESQIAILAREAEHRSKNILATVQATVNLTQADTPEGFKRAIEGRIQALANVNALVVQSRWTGAELRSLVKVVNARVQEVREASEKHEVEALNARDAHHFAEMQKINAKFDEAKRQLEKKTADELGEGAEINLLEALKVEFQGDLIEHVGKGNAGPDIIQTLIHNGRECGTIIYDSKNSAAWRNDYVSKLLRDQTATKADHAVLCTLKFPAEERQIALRDGVIVINPARAIALAHILRKHMTLVHTLRLSKAEREKKMAELYHFITSERCAHLLGRIDLHTDSLLALQEKEMKAHRFPLEAGRLAAPFEFRKPRLNSKPRSTLSSALMTRRNDPMTQAE